MKLQVYTSPPTEDDLLAIGRYYITQVERPDVGLRLVNELYDAFEKLGENQLGRRTDDKLPVNYRRYRVGYYIIFYRVSLPTRNLLIYHV